MIGVLRVTKRTLSWAFLQGTILLGLSALNPYSDTAIVVRVLMLIVAVILAVGLFPNSYLHRFAASSLEQRPERGSSLLVLISTLGPLFMIVLSASAIAANLDTLRLIDELGVEFTDPRWEIYNIVQYAILGTVSLVVLVLNLLDLIRSRGTSRAVCIVGEVYS